MLPISLLPRKTAGPPPVCLLAHEVRPVRSRSPTAGTCDSTSALYIRPPSSVPRYSGAGVAACPFPEGRVERMVVMRVRPSGICSTMRRSVTPGWVDCTDDCVCVALAAVLRPSLLGCDTGTARRTSTIRGAGATGSATRGGSCSTGGTGVSSLRLRLRRMTGVRDGETTEVCAVGGIDADEETGCGSGKSAERSGATGARFT